MNIEEVFTRIYRENIWGDGSPDNPRSGDGSKPSNARQYVEYVKSMIDSLGVRSVLDIGHGDWVMWRDFKFEGLQYIGIDIAIGLSEEVERIHGTSNRIFRHTSAFESGLPKVEMVISKEVLQHLTNQEVVDLLKQLDGYRFIILSNCFFSNKRLLEKIKLVVQPRIRLRRMLNRKNPFYTVEIPKNNSEIVTGEFRGIDLELPPFIDYLNDYRIIDKFDYRGRKGTATHIRTYFLAHKNAKVEFQGH